jgi:hypothetical protein
MFAIRRKKTHPLLLILCEFPNYRQREGVHSPEVNETHIALKALEIDNVRYLSLLCIGP